MKKGTLEVVQACLHCIISRTAEKILWLLSTALSVKRSNGVEHLGLLYIGKSLAKDLTYLLLM